MSRCACSKKRSLDYGMGKIGEKEMKIIGGSVAGYMGTAYLDTFLTIDADGNAKEGMLAENPNYRHAAYVGGGLAAIYYSGDPMVVGAGTGAIIYGAKEFIRGMYPTWGINGTAGRRGGMGDHKYIARSGQKRGMADRKYIAKAKHRKIDFTKKPQTMQPRKEKVMVHNVMM
ncbi:hypothetical protein [Winogradskyella sp.]|uniref:hypothetical protein n=1 Tax=Winogradskyella sp. TaxID=1883156 RepID=UPI002634FF8C|nr:hypothetical protein [Winogradskyella sp.]